MLLLEKIPVYFAEIIPCNGILIHIYILIRALSMVNNGSAMKCGLRNTDLVVIDGVSELFLS